MEKQKMVQTNNQLVLTPKYLFFFPSIAISTGETDLSDRGQGWVAQQPYKGFPVFFP